MKSEHEFEAFYMQQLKPAVDTLEKKRLAIVNKYSFKRYRKGLLALVIITIATMIASNFVPGLSPDQFLFLPFLTVMYAIVAPIFIFIRRNWVFDPISIEYKETVIKNLIAFIDPRLQYDPQKGIDQETFLRSGLFLAPTSYQTEDLVWGEAGNLRVKFADVNATLKVSKKSIRNQSNSGSDSTDNINVFYGLFGQLLLGSSSPVSLYILPNYANTGSASVNALFGDFLKTTGIHSGADHLPGQLLKTGSVAFDESFSVRSTDEQSMKSTLTPDFMSLLLAFKAETREPVELALNNNELYIGFTGANLFEVNAHQSITDGNFTLRFFRYLNLSIGLGEFLTHRFKTASNRQR